MKIKEIAEVLRKQPKDKIVPYGLGCPVSWRGVYAEVAFEPEENISVGEMLENVDMALDKCFEGWKGGDFRYDENTEAHIDSEGNWTDGGAATAMLRKYSSEYDGIDFHRSESACMQILFNEMFKDK